jgi:Raf kinase inhibitor-like YbhB/YbcL family protein
MHFFIKIIFAKRNKGNSMRNVLIILCVSFFIFACQNKNPGNPPKVDTQKIERNTSDMKITSSAFEEGGMIAAKYTCDGQNISPPLSWSDVPAGTVSIALICDDPDAPAGDWVHWVIFNMSPKTNELKENIPSGKILDNGAVQGINDFRKNNYGGPCPPGGTHRYFFKLYALDIKLDADPDMTKAKILKAINGHVLAEAQLIGKYKR